MTRIIIAEIVFTAGDSVLAFLDAAAPLFFLLGLVSAVLSNWLEAIGGMASRGKTRPADDSLLSSNKAETNSALNTFLYGDGWSVPKSYFRHFYLAGLFTLVFIVGFG